MTRPLFTDTLRTIRRHFSRFLSILLMVALGTAFFVGMKATAPDYRNLRARALVENETFIFVGMLLLRDAQKDASREAIAERYIRDAKFDFLRNYELIMSGDCTTIARHEEVIAY